MKRIVCLLLAIAMMSLLFAACGDSDELFPFVDETESRKTALRSAYTAVGASSGSYITIAYDNASLVIDTNPTDSEYNLYEEEAIAAIYSVNASLKLPSSLIEKMSSTRALDGMQSQDCGDYTVSWTYHPDNGLRVIYEVNM